MRPRQIFAVLLLLLASSLCIHAQDEKPAAATDPIQAADKLFHSGKTDEAAAAYEALLKTDAAQAHVRAMLIRTRLLQQKVDEANELAKAGTAREDATAELFAALGDVLFRRAQMGEAETAYLRSKRMDPKQVRAYLGQARLYDAYSMHRRAFDLLSVAHDLAPNDELVFNQWSRRLPGALRSRAIADRLAQKNSAAATSPTPVGLPFKVDVIQPRHACRQVTPLDRTEIDLLSFMLDAAHIRGIGLPVRINDHASRLMLDTGASGIVLGHAAAKRAGLEEIAQTSIGGLGDKGPQSGYVAVAPKIRIGELEFEDCLVTVSDRRNVTGDDGLVGADVFQSYLVEIDGPAKKIRLSPLPNPAGEATPAASLRTGDAEQNTSDGLPRDRYIAPEMAGWSKIFRIGHELLIPTMINDKPPSYFLLDTGSDTSIISMRAAREVTKVYRDDQLKVVGLNGEVEKVYLASKVWLRYGRYAQENRDMIALNLDDQSQHIGTEISGILGFGILNVLDVKIDYRDGLVDFAYDPKKVKLLLH